MKKFKSIIIVITLGLLTACETDSDSPTLQPQNNSEIGAFLVGIDGVFKFDQSGKRAGGFTYRNDYWEFKANGAKLRMAGRFPDDSLGEEQTSIDLEYNNVYLEFMYEVDKKRTRVSCRPAQQPKGQIKRTIHSDSSNSGSFNIELVLCRNTYTSESITEIEVPLIVKGQFENTPYRESLF